MAGAVRGGDGGSLIEAVATPAQREIMDRLTAVMTLVEGHGDYVMDAVGPQVVPSSARSGNGSTPGGARPAGSSRPCGASSAST